MLITRIAPFLLPALFFQSAVFAFISPLPLFVMMLKNNAGLTLLALLCNTAILYALGTPTEISVAVTLWMMVGILFPFLIKKTGRVQLSFGLSFVVFAGFILSAFLMFTAKLGVHPIQYLKTEMGLGITQLAALQDSPVKKLVDEQGSDGLLRQLMTELPSGLLITLLLAFWVNLLFASQMVRGFLSPTFWASFRNPEWLIWPTLAFASLFAFTEHAPYYVGLNGFKVVLVLYGFQGLSIVSHFLNRFKILGLGRALIFSLAIFILMPLVISLGFFDLWFDFRRKFGQN